MRQLRAKEKLKVPRITRIVVYVATLVCFIFGGNHSLSADARIPSADSVQQAGTVQRGKRGQAAPVEALVRDSHGNPLRGLGVILHDLERDKIVRAVTNNQGKVVFECLAFGSYQMTIESLRGYMQAWQGGTATFVHDREGRQVKWTASTLTSAAAQFVRQSSGCSCPEERDEESTEERLLQANTEQQKHAQRSAVWDAGGNGMPSRAAHRAANIETFVIDAQDQPLVGVKITIRDEDGWVVAQEKTDERGAVTVKCLELGKYTMDIAAHTDRWKGGSTSFTLDQEGQAVKWLTSRVLPAVGRFGTGGGMCVCGASQLWTKESLVIPLSIGAALGGMALDGVFDVERDPTQHPTQPGSELVPVSPSQ